MSAFLVEFDRVSFKHGERWILQDLSFGIPAHRVTAILGPSGTGKTTLLRLIGGQLRPQQGEVRFNGQSVNQADRQQLYRMRREMGMLFQSGALFSGMSVFDNVAFPLREHRKLPAAVLRTLVLMKLEAVGLRGAADKMPAELSGGMARRVALARAIALDPSLVMYDEPFVGQDPITLGQLLVLIRQLNDVLGLTSVLVTHDVSEALQLADHLIVLSPQGIVAQGTPEQIQQADSPWLQQFLSGSAEGPVAFHQPARDMVEDILHG